ncbi:DUF4124 domain-containing protein [Geomonas oryzisoli]|uniref:DUF4124 domain-containing protein n=1 Tax=Geomonas oryzisoli TaxID=2847992 RepID=A0ABX8J785_9BACT|nr:DUF4124 domain-containing protein [Geomonas oryzisoli]QWV92996.1 DUF4124 domain-containing protein [Geomonas oryzisoli]
MKALLAVLMVFVSATAACAEIYTWKDNKGTRFYTNSLHEIPARYLKKARVLDVATGKLGGPATAQPPAPAGPASSSAPAPSAPPLLVQQAPPGQPAAPAQSSPQPVPSAQAAAPGAPGAATAAPPQAAPVVEAAPPSQSATRPRGRLSRRELRALGRRSNNTGEE